MRTVKEKLRFYITPKDPVISDKWNLFRNLGKDILTPSAQLKLEWIIYYHTVGDQNAKATAKYFGISRKTLHKWLGRFNDKNLKSLEEVSRAPVHVRARDINLWVLGRVTKLRRAHMKYGKMKLQKEYIKQYGEYISSWKIQKIIESENLYLNKALALKAREKRRNLKRGVKKKRITDFLKQDIIHHLWHVDTVLLSRPTGGYGYLLTAIDDTSRLAYARLYTTHSSKQATDFLNRLNYLTDGKITNIHHDNGSEFKKYFEQACIKLKLPQWYSREHTPKDNPILERFNRTIKEEFVNFTDVSCEDVDDFNHKLLEWLIEYNDLRPHQSLDYQTPLEYITTHNQEKVLPMSPSHTASWL